MGWLKKHHRSEKICIVDPEENTTLMPTDIEEKAQEVAKPVINKDLDYEEKKAFLFKEYTYLELNLKNIIHDYYLCKIYAKAALKDNEFNDLMFSMDRQTNKFRKQCLELNNNLNNLKIRNDVPDEEFDKTYQSLKELELIGQTLYHNINDTRARYYNHLKIATFSICMNKSNQDLEKLFNNLTDYFGQYKNLSEAADDIFVRSGEIITNTIESLLRCLRDSKHYEYLKMYDYHYFLKTEATLYLELPEWVDLYNKIKFVLKATGEVDIANYLDFSRNYREFEIRYLILMLNEETKKTVRK